MSSMNSTGWSLREMLAEWRGQLINSAKTPITLMAFLAMLLLSFASFRTTFSGMLADNLSLDLAFGFTFAVQSLLLFTSWEIAQMITRQREVSTAPIAVFAIAMGLSVMYSFISFYTDAVPKDRRNELFLTNARGEVSTLVNSLQERNDTELARLITEIAAEDPYKEWQKRLTEVGSAARNARKILDDHFGAQLRDARSEVDTKERALSRALAASQNASSVIANNLTEIDDKRTLIATLREKASTAQAELVRLEAAIVAKQAEMDTEERGLNQGSASGRGPKWRALSNEKSALEIQRGVFVATLEKTRSDIDENEARVKELTTENAQLETGVTEGGESATITSLRRELEAAQTRLATLSTDDTDTFDASAQARQLEADLDEFQESFELAAFDRADQRCRTLLTGMRDNAALQQTASQLSCARSPLLAQSMSKVRTVQDAKEALAQQCGMGSSASPSDVTDGTGSSIADDATSRDPSKMNLQELVAFGRSCINLAGLPTNLTSDLSGAVTEIESEGRPNASEITHVWNALSSYEEDAFYSLGRAFALDLLILFAGLMGARTGGGALGKDSAGVERALVIDTQARQGDPADIRKAKAIVEWANPGNQTFDGIRYDYEVGLGDKESHPMKADVRQTLGALVETGRARISPSDPEQYYLSSDAMAFLRDQILTFQERAERLRRLSAGVLQGGSTSQEPTGRDASSSVLHQRRGDPETTSRLRLKPGGLGIQPRVGPGASPGVKNRTRTQKDKAGAGAAPRPDPGPAKTTTMAAGDQENITQPESPRVVRQPRSGSLREMLSRRNSEET